MRSWESGKKVKVEGICKHCSTKNKAVKYAIAQKGTVRDWQVLTNCTNCKKEMFMIKKNVKF